MAIWFLRFMANVSGLWFHSIFKAQNELTDDRRVMAVVFAVNRKCYDAAIQRANEVAAKAEGR